MVSGVRGWLVLVMAVIVQAAEKLLGRRARDQSLFAIARPVFNSAAGSLGPVGNRGSVGCDGVERKPFWSFIRNEVTTAGDPEADLLLYGVIGENEWWDDVTSKGFADELAGLGDVSHIRVRINSPGGDVFAAQAIYNLLRTHKAKVTAHIDGLAASAASVVAMAGDEVIMPSNAMMMIHNPWTYAMGDARDLRKTADTLDTVRDTLLAAYQAKTGMDRTQLINLLNAETWLTADKAKEYGLVDTVTETIKVAACAGSRFMVNGQEMDFSKFNVWPGSLLASASLVDEANGPNESDVIDEVDETGGAAAEDEPKEEPVEEAGGEEANASEVGDPVAVERARIQAIDDLTAGLVGVEKLVFRAKYEKPVSAEALAVELVKTGQLRNAALLDLRRKGAQAADVRVGNTDPANEEGARAERADRIAAQMKKLRGG